MSTLHYYDLKKEYKAKEAAERANRKFNTNLKEERDFRQNDKRQNLETKQEFWEYLAKCPIK